MIELVFKSIEIFYRSINFVLFLCYTTGNILSIIGCYLFWGSFKICSTTFKLIQVILEDFNKFGIDVFQKLNALITCVAETVETCFQYTASVFTYLTYVPAELCGIVLYFLNCMYTIVLKCQSFLIYILRLIKQVLMKIGDGMWYTALILPRTISYILSSILDKLLTVYQTACTVAEYFYNISISMVLHLYTGLQEFNITTVIGLILFTVVVYLFVQHLRLIRQSILEVLRFAVNLCLECWRKIDIWRNDELVEPSDQVPDGEIPEAKLCIICRVLEKNIILYPCKHVCMCYICFVTLRENQDYHCPVCRRRIKKMDRIFYT